MCAHVLHAGLLDRLASNLLLMPVSLVETILLHPYRVISQECCGTTAVYPVQDAVRFRVKSTLQPYTCHGSLNYNLELQNQSKHTLVLLNPSKTQPWVVLWPVFADVAHFLKK